MQLFVYPVEEEEEVDSMMKEVEVVEVVVVGRLTRPELFVGPVEVEVHSLAPAYPLFDANQLL